MLQAIFTFRRSFLMLTASLAALICASAAEAQTGGGARPTGGSTGIGGSSGGLGSSSGSGGLGGTGGGLGSSGSLGGGLGSTGLGSSGGLGMGSSGGSFSGSGSLNTGGTFSGSTGGSGLYSSTTNASSFTSGGFRVGGGGATGSSGATAMISAARYQGIAASNLFSSTYSNPLSAGLSSSSGTGSTSRSFGTPLYSVSTSSTGLTGGVGSAGVRTGSLSNTSSSNNSGNSYRPMVAVNGPTMRTMPIIVAVPRAELQQLLKDSTALNTKDSLQVVAEGGTVVLQGTVVSEHDRKLAEALVRLTPGVRDLRNEIVVQASNP